MADNGNHIAGQKFFIDTTGSIGHDHRMDSQKGHDLYRENNGFKMMSFIIMDPSCKGENSFFRDMAGNDFAAMPPDRRYGKVGYGCVRHDIRILDFIDNPAEPAAGNDTDFRFNREVPFQKSCRLKNLFV